MSKIVTKLSASNISVNGFLLTTYTNPNTVETETVPAGVVKALFRCWGGGGSGSNNLGGFGTGGGGGAFCEVLVDVTPGETFNIYVGQGGNRNAQLGTIAEGGLVLGFNSGGGGGGTLIAKDNNGSFTLHVCAGGGGGAGGLLASAGGGYGGQPGQDGSAFPPFESAKGGNNGAGGAGFSGTGLPGDPGEDMLVNVTLFTDFNGKGGNTFTAGEGAGSGGGGFGGGGAGGDVHNTSGAGGGSYTHNGTGIILNGSNGGGLGGASGGKTQLIEDGLSLTTGDGGKDSQNGNGGAVSIRYYVSSDPLSVPLGVTAGSFSTAGETKTNTLVTTGDANISGNLEPGTNNTYDVGSATLRWREIFAVNGTINTSDRREKRDIIPSDLGLQFINMLEPVQYKWVEGKRPHYGFISQDLKDVMDELGIDFGGYTKSIKYKKDPEGGENIPDGDVLGIRYNELIAPLTKAVQELSLKNDLLEKSCTNLEDFSITILKIVSDLLIINQDLVNEYQTTKKQLTDLGLYSNQLGERQVKLDSALYLAMQYIVEIKQDLEKAKLELEKTKEEEQDEEEPEES